MSEHHTQGRQGQGARHHRRYRNNANRNHRQRMPRAEEKSTKPSLIKRVLAFFGIGKKKDAPSRKKGKNQEKKQTPPQRVRVAQSKQPHEANAKPAGKNRRRPASVPPTSQARLYVGNLSFEATESDLEELFKGFGNVRSVEIIYNQRTFRSKGYAFVEMMQLADARRAAEVLHGQPFMGRELMVSAASEKTDHAEDAPAPVPTPAPVSDAEDDREVDFGEEVVVNLTPDTPAVEPAPAPVAEEQNS